MSRLALITGASRGIGRAIAERLSSDGCNVAINYLYSRTEAEALSARLGSGAEIFCADVADRGAVHHMFEGIMERFGMGPDVLINNAGISHWGLFSEVGEDVWRRLFAVNVDGAFHCAQLALPHMLKERSGCIVNISSVWGVRGASCEAAYSASKAALIGLTKALAQELGPSGIRVNCVAPGVIDTDMNASHGGAALDALKEAAALNRRGTPEDVAGVVSFLCSSDAQFITGQVIGADGGF